MKDLLKIGFGGGCHWCTEAVFQSLKGVEKVEQGYISIKSDPEKFYEGVIVHFRHELINMVQLVEIHLKTHKSTSNHSMRSKYLSAVYAFNEKQHIEVENILNDFQKNYIKEIITSVYNFGKFKASREDIRNYYTTDPNKPFCETYIDPKLNLLREAYPELL